MTTMISSRSLPTLKPDYQKRTGSFSFSKPKMNLRVVLSRKVEELVDNQSRRWEEFCRMANNMKSLSADMIQQVNISCFHLLPVMFISPEYRPFPHFFYLHHMMYHCFIEILTTKQQWLKIDKNSWACWTQSSVLA